MSGTGNMVGTGNMGDAAIKLFSVETFIKDSPLYEENVFKIVDEVLEILDRISTSPVESNQESSSQQFNASLIILMKIRAHALRLLNWNGSIDKLPMIRSSCTELGRLGYTMNNEELRIFNDKLKTSLNQTMHCLSAMIHDLNIKDGIVKHTKNNLEVYGDKLCARFFTGPMKSRSRSLSPRKKINTTNTSSIPIIYERGDKQLSSVSSITKNILEGSILVDKIINNPMMISEKPASTQQ